MNILANIRSKICIKGRLIISPKFVTIWVVKRGEWVKANFGKVWQGGRGSKIGGRPLTYFLNGPLAEVFNTLKAAWYRDSRSSGIESPKALQLCSKADATHGFDNTLSGLRIKNYSPTSKDKLFEFGWFTSTQ